MSARTSDAAPEACEDAVCRRRDEMFDAMRRATSGTSAENRSFECPPDVDELGRGAWTLMHTVAARYPVREGDETRDTGRSGVIRARESAETDASEAARDAGATDGVAKGSGAAVLRCVGRFVPV